MFEDLPLEKVAFGFAGATPVSGVGVWSLAAREPYFNEMLAECDKVIAEEAGWSLKSMLWDFPDRASAARPSRHFPLLVTLQIAMFRLLRHYGMDGGNVIGLSSGEVSAAYAAGAIDLREALRVAVQAGILLEPEIEGCRMARVWLSGAECEQVLASVSDRVAIAALLEPQLTVVSGEHQAVVALLERLATMGIRGQLTLFPWGAHTSLVKGACSAFEAMARPTPSRIPRRRIFSTSRGEWMQTEFDAAYWSHMFRAPVQFFPAVERMRDDGVELFVEVGPGLALVYLIERIGGRSLGFPDALTAAKKAAGSLPTGGKAIHDYPTGSPWRSDWMGEEDE